MPATGEATGKRLWKAGELARQTGLTRQALHQYVHMGLLAPVDYSKGGQRLFDDETVELVRLIQDLRDIGYHLGDIRDIFIKRRK